MARTIDLLTVSDSMQKTILQECVTYLLLYTRNRYHENSKLHISDTENEIQLNRGVKSKHPKNTEQHTLLLSGVAVSGERKP